MLYKLPIVALAALSAVQASPLHRRQESASSAATGAASAASSAVSSAVESATSAAASGASSATSAAGNATSAASSAVANATSTASSAAATSTGAAAGGETGNQSYPLYPCPTGFLLTYVQQNVTLDIPVTQATQAIGNWSDSPIFPNVTESSGGTEVGATHTLNVGGVNVTEQLVNVTTNSTSGYAMWNWNLTNGPITAMNVSVSNYSTVFKAYDPNFESTGSIGNTTFAQIYVNFCANEQAGGIALVGALTQAELGAIQQIAAGGNSTAGGAGGSSSSAAPSSTEATSAASSSASEATSSAASGASSATSAAASGASSATSAAASGASSAASGASSAASGAASAAASAVSGATSAAAGAATSSA